MVWRYTGMEASGWMFFIPGMELMKLVNLSLILLWEMSNKMLLVHSEWWNWMIKTVLDGWLVPLSVVIHVQGYVGWWIRAIGETGEIGGTLFLPLWEMSKDMLSHWMKTFSGRYSMLDMIERSGKCFLIWYNFSCFCTIDMFCICTYRPPLDIVDLLLIYQYWVNLLCEILTTTW